MVSGYPWRRFEDWEVQDCRITEDPGSWLGMQNGASCSIGPGVKSVWWSWVVG